MHRSPEPPGLIELNGIRVQAPSPPANMPASMGAPYGHLPATHAGLPMVPAHVGAGDRAVARALLVYRRPVGLAFMLLAIAVGTGLGMSVGLWLGFGVLWGVFAGVGVSVVPGTAGLYLLLRDPRGSALVGSDRHLEQGLLALAQQRGGTLSPAEAALELRASLDDVQEELRRLARNGTCERDFDIELGRELYLFPDFKRPQLNSER